MMEGKTQIFHVLRWHDRSEILKGARQAYPVKCTQDNATLRKAEDFVSSLSQKRAFAMAPQGSGKAAATFSSARREGIDGRDRGDVGCPEEDGGRRDMDAC